MQIIYQQRGCLDNYCQSHDLVVYLRCCRHSRVRFLPITRGSDNGYLPSKAALRHASVTSDRIGLKKSEHAPQHHL